MHLCSEHKLAPSITPPTALSLTMPTFLSSAKTAASVRAKAHNGLKWEASRLNALVQASSRCSDPGSDRSHRRLLPATTRPGKAGFGANRDSGGDGKGEASAPSGGV